METTPSIATWAVLGYHNGTAGVLSWFGDEVSAYRHLKIIRVEGGRGKVVPVVDGQLTEEHQREKADMFKTLYERSGVGK